MNSDLGGKLLLQTRNSLSVGLRYGRGNRPGPRAEGMSNGQAIPKPNQGLSPLPLLPIPSLLPLVAMYREPSLHDVGETVLKAGVTPSKSTSASAIMNGGKPTTKSKTT